MIEEQQSPLCLRASSDNWATVVWYFAAKSDAACERVASIGCASCHPRAYLPGVLGGIGRSKGLRDTHSNPHASH
jgi:hypothetical protein